MAVERLLLRPVECAEAIGESRSKTYELIARGEIPSILVGGRRRVPVEALKARIAQQLQERAEAK